MTWCENGFILSPIQGKGAQADETYSRCPAQAARANALLPDKFPADRLRKNRKMPLSGRSVRTYIVTIKGEPTMADYKLWNALKDAKNIAGWNFLTR